MRNHPREGGGERTWNAAPIVGICLAFMGALAASTPVWGAPLFGAPRSYPVGTSPVGIAAGEFSGTPGLDLATANEGNTVTILKNQGNGVFTRGGAVDIETRFTATAIVSGRFNNDLIDDFAISANDIENPDFNGSIVTYSSTAAFQYTSNPVTAGLLPGCITFADLSGDDIPDLAGCGSAADSSGLVSLLRGKSDGTFAAASGISTGNIIPSRLVIADIDHDPAGLPDLLIVDQSGGAVWILYGKAPGSLPGPAFEMPAKLGQIEEPTAAVVAPFAHDTLPDIAVASRLNNVFIFHQRAARDFETPVAYRLGVFPLDLATADFDQSGTLDLISANNGSSDVTLLLGNADGTFQQGETVHVGTGPVAIVTGKFNNDDKPDFATANQDDDTFGTNVQSVSVVLNGVNTFDPNCDGKLDEDDVNIVIARIFDGTSGCLTRPVTAADVTLTVEMATAQ